VACRANIRRKIVFAFCSPYGRLLLVVFNRCFVRGDSNGVLSCLERERLEEEFSEARSRGRNLSRLRNLTPLERAALEGREQAAQTRLTTTRSMGASGRRSDCRFGAEPGCGQVRKRDSARMNRVVNSTFRNVPGGVRTENVVERSECRAFPARTREIRLCRCKFLLSSTEV